MNRNELVSLADRPDMIRLRSQVVYIPNHVADGFDLRKPTNGIEFGFVDRLLHDPASVGVRYWKSDLKELRTKFNDEVTPVYNLYFWQSVRTHQVEAAWATYVEVD